MAPKNKQKAKANIGTSKRISDAITPPNIPTEELVYQRSKGRQPIPHPEAHGGMQYDGRNPDLHHIIGKRLRYAFLQKALQLDPAGGAAKLTQTDSLWGLQAGSGYKGLLPMDLHAHRPGHALARSRGIEPWGKTLDTLNDKIANASSMDELLSTYGGYIKNHVIPELAHQRSMQGGYEKAGAVGGRVPQNELAKLADQWAAQDARLREHRKDEAYRQGGPSPEAMGEWDMLNSANYSPWGAVDPIMTGAELPKLKPQEKVRLPQTTATGRPEALPKLKPQKKIEYNPNDRPATPKISMEIPVMSSNKTKIQQASDTLKIGYAMSQILPKLLEGGKALWAFGSALGLGGAR